MSDGCNLKLYMYWPNQLFSIITFQINIFISSSLYYNKKVNFQITLYVLQIKRYLNVHFQSFPFEICRSKLFSRRKSRTNCELTFKLLDRLEKREHEIVDRNKRRARK